MREFAERLREIASEIEAEQVAGRQMTIILVKPSEHGIQLSRNFRAGEFACRSGIAGILIHKDLLEGLQRMRDMIGKPIRITSGYRCYEHNVAVDGAENSMHMWGKAADVVVNGMTGDDIATVARQVGGFNGIGIGANMCHVDVRKTPATWRY